MAMHCGYKSDRFKACNFPSKKKEKEKKERREEKDKIKEGKKRKIERGNIKMSLDLKNNVHTRVTNGFLLL